MKKFKSTLTVLIAAIMMVALWATPAFAEGNTGTITINKADSNVSMAGKTFSAYKILDVTTDGSGYAYTVPEAMQSFFTSEFSITETAGTAAYNQAVSTALGALNATEMEQFGKDALAAAKNAGITAVTTTGSGTSAVFSNVPYGYYVIEDTSTPATTGTQDAISAVIVNTAAPDVSVNLKAKTPTVEKNIVEGKNKVKGNEASIGDKVSYEVDSNVPDMTGYNKYYYVFNDTLSKGLTFNNDVKVSIGGTELASDAYTVTTSDQTFKIVLNKFIQYKAQKGAAIVITYSATLNKYAEIGSTANTNDIDLTYSNNPNYDYQGDNEPGKDEPHGVTPKSETKTYTTQVTVKKVDTDGNILTGAEFTLTGTNGVNVVVTTKGVFEVDNDKGTYYLLKDGTYSTTAPADYTGDKYALNQKVEVQGKGQTQTTVSGFVDANGQITFTGLGVGDYTLTETKVPSGFNGIDPVKFSIKFTCAADGSTPAFSSTNDSVKLDGTTNTFVTTITNKKGSLLPTTGNVGTGIFTAVGIVIMVAAGVAIVTKQKMKTTSR
ncbi:MAG: isopeptide-forming domain-containing fimbrial protein [Eubacteriaceae bacterium]|jgi:fimbrial isopeptide formation D2 family protein